MSKGNRGLMGIIRKGFTAEKSRLCMFIGCVSSFPSTRCSSSRFPTLLTISRHESLGDLWVDGNVSPSIAGHGGRRVEELRRYVLRVCCVWTLFIVGPGESVGVVDKKKRNCGGTPFASAVYLLSSSSVSAVGWLDVVGWRVIAATAAGGDLAFYLSTPLSSPRFHILFAGRRGVCGCQCASSPAASSG